MSTDFLKSALAAVDWNANVTTFLGQGAEIADVAAVSHRLAIWSQQLETVEAGNPALSFVREMQISVQHTAVLIALGLYKPAASSIRTMIETALYFTYFRTHLDELTTLQRNKDYYISKDEVVEYHKMHSSRFNIIQAKLGFVQRLKELYKELSAIVHGQVPGVWMHHVAIKDIKHVDDTRMIVINVFIRSVDIVHRLFLCTVAQVHWDDFSHDAKKPLLSGMTGEEKAILQLDIK